jgi:short-subunit dehydrogenase
MSGYLELEGKRALVTGATKGVGEACSTTTNGTRRWTRTFSRRSVWIARFCRR